MGLGQFLNPGGSRLSPDSVVFPRRAGKPDPRWQTFDWKFIDPAVPNAPMRLYFYQEESWVAEFALPEIKHEIDYLKGVFNYTPKEKFSYLLFSSHRNFQQTHVFNITEGVQGVTSTQEPVMAIPYWGEAETFRHISTHEMVHQFQIQKMNELSNSSSQQSAVQPPLWFIEGMAEYYSLHGLDAESKLYIRDLLLYPNEEQGYKMPKLFEVTPLNFVFAYKLGQAKIDFFETEFGEGTAQKILEVTSKNATAQEPYSSFVDLVAQQLGKSPAELEHRWDSYIIRKFKFEADQLSQSMEEFESLKDAGDTLDHYEISPDGNLLVTREIDPLIGTTLIKLRDLKKGLPAIEVTHDHQPSVLSLYFMQNPILTLTNDTLAYVVETTSGPEIEIQSIRRDKDENLQLRDRYRVKVHQDGISEAHSLALKHDNSAMAFVGLTEQGHGNIWILDLDVPKHKAKLKRLTREPYSWKNLNWANGTLVGTSNRTPELHYNLFEIDTKTGKILRQLTSSKFDQLNPDGKPDDHLVFQSISSGSPQIHLIKNGVETQLTSAKVGLFSPKYRKNTYYAIGFKGGRYHLYRLYEQQTSKKAVIPQADPNDFLNQPWKPTFQPLKTMKVESYKPFSTSGMRLENIAGFFATGSIGGVSVGVSDLMRDYFVSGQYYYLGSARLSTFNLLFSSQRGRTTWTVGPYFSALPRLDDVTNMDGGLRTYVNREFGLMAGAMYPFGAFFFVETQLRLAGVNRTDYSDPNMSAQFDAINPGSEFMIDPVIRLGYDRVMYETFTGPISGYSILVEGDTSYFPDRNAFSERGRLDTSWYYQVSGRTVIALETLFGGSWGGPFRNPFYVLSDDILRAYIFGDSRLLGNYVMAAKAELRFPIGSMFKFPPFRGLIAYDYGSIFTRLSDANDKITSSFSAGLAFNLPPIGINFILTRPFQTAPGPVDANVFHFTLRYLYF
jgi:hypothetical protein